MTVSEDKPGKRHNIHLASWADFVDEIFRKVFYSYGFWLGGHPFTAIVLGILMVGVCCIGLACCFREENSYEIFQPHRTMGWKDNVFVDSYFATEFRTEATVMIARAENVLTGPILTDMFEIEQRLNKLDAGGKTFEDVCQPISSVVSTCSQLSLFRLLGVTSQAGLDQLLPNINIALESLPPVLRNAIVGGVVYDSSDPSKIVGAKALQQVWPVQFKRDQKNPTSSAWSEAAFKTMEDEAARVAGTGKYELYYYNQWGLDEMSSKLTTQEIPLMGGTIVLILVYMAAILGGRPPVYSRLMLGSLCIVTVLLALAGSIGITSFIGVDFTLLSPLVIFVLLGVGVDDMIIMIDCLELTKARHAAQNPDNPLLPMPELIARSLRAAGHAITITSVTSAIAFFFASNVDFQSVSWFCITGGLGILAVFILQLFLFGGALVLDERRVRAERYDCFCCCWSRANRNKKDQSEGVEVEKVSGDGTVTSPTSPNGQPNGAPNGKRSSVHLAAEAAKATQVTFSRRMVHALGGQLARPLVASIVVLLFLAGSAFASYQMTTVGTNGDNLQFYEPDSFVRQFFEESSEYFVFSTSIVSIVLNDRLAYWRADVQSELRALLAKADELDFVKGQPSFWDFVKGQPSFLDFVKGQPSFWDFVKGQPSFWDFVKGQPSFWEFVKGQPSFWVDTLELYAEREGLSLSTEASFKAALTAFTTAEPFAYNNTLTQREEIIVPKDWLNDLVFLSEEERLQGTPSKTRLRFDAAFASSSDVVIDQTAELRGLLPTRMFPPPQSTAATSGAIPAIHAFVHSPDMVSADRDKTMVFVIATNLVYSGVGVMGVLILLVPPHLVAMIVLIILMIDIDLLGIMAVWDMKLDVSSFICLAMAIGLSVDYVVHMGHSYIRNHRKLRKLRPHLTGTARNAETMRIAFEEMGVSVLNGGFSTFLGILLLAFANSPGFRTFFKILFGTVLLGLLHGLIFAPALFTVIAYFFPSGACCGSPHVEDGDEIFEATSAPERRKSSDGEALLDNVPSQALADAERELLPSPTVDLPTEKGTPKSTTTNEDELVVGSATEEPTAAANQSQQPAQPLQPTPEQQLPLAGSHSSSSLVEDIAEPNSPSLDDSMVPATER
eukprot:g7920.t1